jgi:hypothetical protein
MRRTLLAVVLTAFLSWSVGFAWGRGAPEHPLPGTSGLVGSAEAAPYNWCFFERRYQYDPYWGSYTMLTVYTDQHVSSLSPRVPYDCQAIQ